MIKPTGLPVFVNVKNVLIVGLGIAVIYLVVVSWWTPKPVDIEALTKKLREDVKKEFIVELGKNKTTIDDQNIKIKSYKNSAYVSSQKVITLEKRIKEIIDAQAIRVPPKTVSDTRKRLSDLDIDTF